MKWVASWLFVRNPLTVDEIDLDLDIFSLNGESIIKRKKQVQICVLFSSLYFLNLMDSYGNFKGKPLMTRKCMLDISAGK